MEILQENGIRYYRGDITPGDNIVMVFGSNPEGRHGAGAAKVAREQFGAVYGQGEGLQGNAYALPTKDLRVKENRGLRSISPEAITENIKRLYQTARENPGKSFCIAYRNTDRASLNGYTGIEMMRMFAAAGPLPENILVSEEWYNAGKEILSFEPVQRRDRGQVLTLDELLDFHAGSIRQYVGDDLATENLPLEEVMGDALSNTVRDALERGDNPAVVRLWAERAMKENEMTEEQRTVADKAVESIVLDNDIVLGSDGKPLVLWHGSPAEFEEFDFSHAGDNTGLVEYTNRETGEKILSDSDKAIFFTDNRELAISYGFLARTQELRHLTGLMTDLISCLRDPLHPFFTDYIKSKKDLIEGVRILRRENDPEINAFLDRLPDLNGEKPISSMDENSREELRNKLIQIRGRYEGYYNMNRNGGISNRLDNLTRAKDYLQYFVENFDMLCEGDTTVMTEYGEDFNHYNQGFYSSEGNIGISFFIGPDGKEMKVAGFKDVPVLLKTLSPDQRKEILQRIEDDLNACIGQYNADLEASGYREHTHLYPVLLKAKNSLEHDYQESAFPDKYKSNEKYSTAYIAARQVRKALADGNDAVVYKNIRDPFLGDTYGVFSKENIVMLDRSLFPEEQLDSTLGKVSGTVQRYMDSIEQKVNMEQKVKPIDVRIDEFDLSPEEKQLYQLIKDFLFGQKGKEYYFENKIVLDSSYQGSGSIDDHVESLILDKNNNIHTVGKTIYGPGPDFYSGYSDDFCVPVVGFKDSEFLYYDDISYVYGLLENEPAFRKYIEQVEGPAVASGQGVTDESQKPLHLGRISVVNVKTYGGPDGFERMSKSNVYIGRRPGGNILGNPFTHIQGKQTLAKFVVGSRQESVDKYAEYFDSNYGKDKAYTAAIDKLVERVRSGEDIVLGCWCKPLACHGDILKEKIENILGIKESVQQGVLFEENSISSSQAQPVFGVSFIEDNSSYYTERTRKNAEAADVTIAFAKDFKSRGEVRTKIDAGSRYIPIDMPPKDFFRYYDLPDNRRHLDIIARKLEIDLKRMSSREGFSLDALKVNVAGNGISTLDKHGYTQEDADRFVEDVFRILKDRAVVRVASIRSGGQTGFDEAGIKAAVALDIPATVLAPKGWRFRIEGDRDVYGEQAFKARFLLQPLVQEYLSSSGDERSVKEFCAGLRDGIGYSEEKAQEIFAETEVNRQESLKVSGRKAGKKIE